MLKNLNMLEHGFVNLMVWKVAYILEVIFNLFKQFLLLIMLNHIIHLEIITN